MRIILTKAIATDHLGSIPKGSVLELPLDVGEHLVARGVAQPVGEESEPGEVDDGIVREFDDAGCSGPAVAEDSGSDTDGTDGAAG
jgi:hypothetical protein